MQKLTELLRRAARETPGADLDAKPAEQPPPGDQAALTTVQAAGPSPAPLGIPQRLVRAEQSHWRWLRTHPWVIGIAIALMVAVVAGEAWLIVAGQQAVYYVKTIWGILSDHPVAAIGSALILFYVIFGLHWLYDLDDLGRWLRGVVKSHPRLTTFIGGILLLIGLWAVNNSNTWVVLPFTVGQLQTSSLDGEKVAVQLLAELNQVGVGNPTPALILWDIREPRTASGSVSSRRSLPLEECDTVLQGPGGFFSLRRSIPLPRVLTGSQGNRLDLGNLSLGTISIPSQIFTQFLLKILPTGYREFSGQISENNGELEISISSQNPPNAWRITGPSSAYPEMMEYLALRMALDLNPDVIKSSGLSAPPADPELTFAMGNEAFRQQRYGRAMAFYELADRLKPLDEKIDAMLGLTTYQLALQQPGNDPSRFGPALGMMETAVREDPNGDSSVLRPYLVCLYHKSGQEEQAAAQNAIFTQYLLRLEFQDFDVRIAALKQTPLRGPGRHLAAQGGDVILVDEAGDIVGAAGQPLSQGLLLPNDKGSPGPRQIGIYGQGNLVYISPDGAVLTYPYGQTGITPTLKTLIEGRTLQGVEQIGTSTSQFGRDNLFILNRFGKTYWCEPGAEAGSTSACPPRQPLLAEQTSPTDVRQIFPAEDRLYMLAADGAVWYTEININGQAITPRQLTQPAPVQEIFAAGDRTLYLLQENGNVWRYYDDGLPATEDNKLVDTGTGTVQIFAAGGYLYLLKSDGPVWRISNPRNPAPSSDIVKIAAPPEGSTIQEIFVTADPSPPGQETSNSRTIYLLTDRRKLLLGTDTGSTQMSLAPVNNPATQAPAQ
jgi:hypothetical protein